jgi:hypothetical protein
MEINEGNECYGVSTVLDPRSRSLFTPEISDPDPRSGIRDEKKIRIQDTRFVIRDNLYLETHLQELSIKILG